MTTLSDIGTNGCIQHLSYETGPHFDHIYCEGGTVDRQGRVRWMLSTAATAVIPTQWCCRIMCLSVYCFRLAVDSWTGTGLNCYNNENKSKRSGGGSNSSNNHNKNGRGSSNYSTQQQQQQEEEEGNSCNYSSTSWVQWELHQHVRKREHHTAVWERWRDNDWKCHRHQWYWDCWQHNGQETCQLLPCKCNVERIRLWCKLASRIWVISYTW